MAVKASSETTLTRVNDGAAGAKGADGKMLYATSSTAAATAAKVATLSSGTLTLTAGATVSVKFTYGNTAASPTLNVNSTGAKAIYTQGVRYAYWQAGVTVVFVYDGSCWRVASEPVYANTVTVGNASGRNLYIDADSVDIRSGSTALATFAENKLVLGKASDSATIDMCNGNIKFSTKVYTGSNTGNGQITAQNGMGIYSKGTGEGDGDGLIEVVASRMLDLQGKQVEIISTDDASIASNKNLYAWGNVVDVTYDEKLSLNGSTVADFIVETGVSQKTYGTWTYRKYNSGAMEIWGKFTKTHDGTSYLEFVIAAPSSMTTISTIHASAGATGNLGANCRYVAGDGGTTVDVWVEPGVAKGKSVWVYIHAFGTWK